MPADTMKVAEALKAARGGRASIDPDAIMAPDVPDDPGAEVSGAWGGDAPQGEENAQDVTEDVAEEGEDDGEAVAVVEDEPPKPAKRARKGAQGQETASTDEAEAPTPEQIAEWQRQAGEAAQIQQLLNTSPDYVAALMMQRMTPQQRQTLAAQMGLATAGAAAEAEPTLDGNYAELTIPEKLAWDSRDWLKKGPQEFQQFRQQAEQSLQRHEQINLFRDYQLAVLEERLNAFSDLLELSLPEASLPEVDAVLASMGGDVRKAVAEAYGKKVKAAVTMARQKQKARPKTPGNSSEASPAFKQNGHVDLRDILDYQRAHGRLPPLPEERR